LPSGGDLITLTSNEELACALSYSDGNLLRLVAVSKDAPVTNDSDVPASRDFPCARRGRGGRWHGDHGMHGGHGKHMHGGRGMYCGQDGHGMHGGWGSEMFKAKMISKRDFFKSQLDELEKVPEKTPEQQLQILRLQKKLKKIECRLEGGWEKKEMKGKHCAKWAAKKEKRRQKFEKRMRKRDKKDKCSPHQLSEETQTQIAMLKSQIGLLKPGMKEVKSQIKAKKDALKEAKATGGDPHQLLKEISVLKETRNVQKSQVKPLKEKIRELKYASC